MLLRTSQLLSQSERVLPERHQPAVAAWPLCAPRLASYTSERAATLRCPIAGQLRNSVHCRAAAVDDAGAEAPKQRGRRKRKVMDNAPEVIEPGAPRVPAPAEFQQTLIRSFTLAGIGLHSGELAVVRVRPAYAGEGRYFVRVPPGTNSPLFTPGEAEELPTADPDPDTPELAANKVQMNQLYRQAVEAGFGGTMEEFLLSVDASEVKEAVEAGLDPYDDWEYDPVEEIQQRSDGEPFLKANINNVYGPQAISTWIGDVGVLDVDLGDLSDEDEADEDEEPAAGGRLPATPIYVASVELLMSALEACGVDNCRIEIEGGDEIPILDGSALPWALEVQWAGLRPAPLTPAAEAEAVAQQTESAWPVLRALIRPDQVITVRDGDAFISLYPEDTIRLTVGVDHGHDAEVIGSQWKSWCPFEDLPYRFFCAGARTYAVAPEQCLALRDYGFLKGGTDGCVLVAYGDRWWDPAMLRYVEDEPVRHALADLIGDLALNAVDGDGGLPIGHIVAYKPTNDLVMDFVRELRSVCGPEHIVTMEELITGQADADATALSESLVDEAEGRLALLGGDEAESEEGEWDE